MVTIARETCTLLEGNLTQPLKLLDLGSDSDGFVHQHERKFELADRDNEDEDDGGPEAQPRG